MFWAPEFVKGRCGQGCRNWLILKADVALVARWACIVKLWMWKSWWIDNHSATVSLCAGPRCFNVEPFHQRSTGVTLHCTLLRRLRNSVSRPPVSERARQRAALQRSHQSCRKVPGKAPLRREATTTSSS